MRVKKIITGIIVSLFFANLVIADSSINYTIDISGLNSGGTLSSSANYKTNETFIGFVDGEFGYSASYILGSGLVYLELLCGNNILEFGEGCDDGNTTSGDGCSNVCQIEGVGPVCGNGILEIGETCDDGNLISGDGCSNICVLEAVPPTPPGGGGIVPLCGNGVREGMEQCDDGNNESGDGCSAICRTEEEIPEELKPAAEEIPRTIKIKARPEKRVNPSQNWGTRAKVVFYNKTLRKTALETAIEINDIGWGILETDRLPEGIYNISIKGLSHLTKVMRNITIDSENHTFDFTFGESFYMTAGDVHGGKDDFVNGLDISSAVQTLYGNNIHADLNRDGLVNGLDISITVGNLYRQGQKI